jgi:hypothetical protein
VSYQLADLEPFDLSVALTADTDLALGAHLHKPKRQEDLAFAYWRPSVGARRYTAIISSVAWPGDDERLLHGNAAFRAEYLDRVLREVPEGAGIAFLHGHPGPGWQEMSYDDTVAERDRLAGAVAGRTGLPLVGLTRGTDGAWSARFWARSGPRAYERRDARTVRVIGRRLQITFHPNDVPMEPTAALGETLTVWGRRAHDDLVRSRIGIVGLGNVGGLAAEASSRMGLSRLSYIDHDLLETRNLDRTHGAAMADVVAGLSKVAVAARATATSHTAADVDLRLEASSVLSDAGYAAALDCDVLLSCVDRPLPRHLLNAIAYAHLIPVVDGGIAARVTPDGRPLHIDWRIQTVGPGRACLACIGALRRSDVALDRDGKLDDPEYIAGLPEAERAALSRRNVFPFGMSVAAHQVLQMVGLVTGLERVGGIGPQMYHAYPGQMEVLEAGACEDDCEYDALTATGRDLRLGLTR